MVKFKTVLVAIYFLFLNSFAFSDHYIRFNSIADGILDFNSLFDGGNDYNFYTCIGGSCGGSLIEQFNEQIGYLQYLSNQNKITVEIYEQYKSISKNRTNTIYDFIDLLDFDKLEQVENKFDLDCEEFEVLFKKKSDDCNSLDQDALNISSELEQFINDFSFVASKEELSTDNNNKLKEYYDKTQNLLEEYENKLKEVNSKIVSLVSDEKNRLEKEKLEKKRQEEEKQYYAELDSNFENKTKLFGVQLTDSPENYNLKDKRVLNEDFAGGFYYENTTNDYYKRNFNIDVKDIIYTLEPPIVNNSFYSYQIIAREFDEIKIITDVIAKAKLINKGFEGCDEFFYPIKEALFKKYGFVLNEHFNVMTENKQNIDVVLLSDCLVGDTISVDPYDQLLSADTLHLRLRANISEEQFLMLFNVDPDNRNKVDTDNF